LLTKVNLFIGFDQTEAIAYHVFAQSVIEHSSLPVQFTPLSLINIKNYQESHHDGSNQFIYSRFLTPYINDFSGWVIFADGDMVCNSDIAELWGLRDESKAVQVVKHDYKTKQAVKYLGNKNEDYPRKNWSSLILWNCGHPANKVLTPKFVSEKSGSYLHRFSWLSNDLIGGLPKEWNWLAIEYPDNPAAKIIHYTLGTPCFKEYSNTSMASLWHEHYQRAVQGFD
jgi:lipopolysaccharide biosynthesis glycosyltransferase